MNYLYQKAIVLVILSQKIYIHVLRLLGARPSLEKKANAGCGSRNLPAQLKTEVNNKVK